MKSVARFLSGVLAILLVGLLFWWSVPEGKPAKQLAVRVPEGHTAFNLVEQQEEVYPQIYVGGPFTPTLSPAVRDLPPFTPEPPALVEMHRRLDYFFPGPSIQGPEALAAFRWFVDLQVKEKVVPDAVAEEAESSENRFLNGRLAMYFNSRRGVPTYRAVAAFRWDVAPLPRGREEASILHSDGFCMAAVAKDKEAAWALIEFANSVEGQKILAETGRIVPSLRQVAESPAFLDPGRPPTHSHIFLDVIPDLHSLPILARWSTIEETADREIEAAFYGRISVEEATARAISLTRSYFQETGP